MTIGKSKAWEGEVLTIYSSRRLKEIHEILDHGQLNSLLESDSPDLLLCSNQNIPYNVHAFYNAISAYLGFAEEVEKSARC